MVAASLSRETGSAVSSTTFHFRDQRMLITEQLSARLGKHIVLVCYDFDRHYPGNELVHNGADLVSGRILWARSKGDRMGFGFEPDLCRQL